MEKKRAALKNTLLSRSGSSDKNAIYDRESQTDIAFLKTAAEGYQIMEDGTKFNKDLANRRTNFDDPRDQDMIEYGYHLYYEEHGNE